jgi:alpha-galactosidase
MAIGNYNCFIFNCKGEVMREEIFEINAGILELKVPACGLAKLTLKN